MSAIPGQLGIGVGLAGLSPSAAAGTGPQTGNNGPTGNDAVRPATVRIGIVTPDDNNAAFVEFNNPLMVFPDYEIRNFYEQDRAIYMLGLSSPGGFRSSITGRKATAAFVQLHSPTTLWLVDWTAVKTFEQPEVPDPGAVGDNWVLLDVHLELAKVTVADDGVTPLYRISGTYAYGALNPDDNAFNDANFPRPPWLDDSFKRSVDLSKLTENLAANGLPLSITAPGNGPPLGIQGVPPAAPGVP